MEWALLRFSATYWGCGVERGRGEPVILVPGFLGNDWYLAEMYHWLARMGYRPYYSGIDFNVDCPDATATELAWTARRAVDETGHRATLVGHSLGGLLARAVAYRNPELIAGVIAVGAPIGETARVSPFIESVCWYRFST